MKRQRYRFKIIALLITVLFILAGVYGLRSIHHYGSRWFSYAANPRLAAQKQRITEGDILDRNGVLLATTREGARVFADSAAARKALVHVVGDRQGMISGSVESFHAGYLYGYSSSLLDAFRHLLHPEEERKGNEVTLTVDAGLSAAVPAAFEARPVTKGKSGAAVVINYRTGEILALVSLPSFDPDHPSAEEIAGLDHPYFNRATQALLPPGSTFKIVTAAAALSRLKDAESRHFSCSGSLPVSETFTVRDFGGAAHGDLSLSQAFYHSCNSVFASLALELGDAALRAEAEHFAFNRNFLFRDLVVYNSRYPAAVQTREALAASGYGQSALAATPMHLCLISAAVARGGEMPEPRLLRQVRSAAGGTLLSFSAAPAGMVCSASVASRLSGMMKSVVQDGSGHQAAVPTLDIRGKTGTAVSTVGDRTVSYGWFTGFNAQGDLPAALCVLVEDIPEGETGGTTSALIAHDLFLYLKNHPEII